MVVLSRLVGVHTPATIDSLIRLELKFLHMCSKFGRGCVRDELFIMKLVFAVQFKLADDVFGRGALKLIENILLFINGITGDFS